MKLLVAGVGKVLRGDDGFGVAVAERLLSGTIPDGVRVMDMGIGGIHLVQELMGGVDALIIVDALHLDRPPGTVLVFRPDVRDVRSLTLWERHDELADMHYATPGRALMLGRALEVMPERTLIVGCQPADAESLSEGLSAPVRRAVERAAAEVRRVVSGLGIPWSEPPFAPGAAER